MRNQSSTRALENALYAESSFICHSVAGNVKKHLRRQTRKDSRVNTGQNMWPKLTAFNLAYQNAMRLPFTTDRKTLNKINLNQIKIWWQVLTRPVADKVERVYRGEVDIGCYSVLLPPPSQFLRMKWVQEMEKSGREIPDASTREGVVAGTAP